MLAKCSSNVSTSDSTVDGCRAVGCTFHSDSSSSSSPTSNSPFFLLG